MTQYKKIQFEDFANADTKTEGNYLIIKTPVFSFTLLVHCVFVGLCVYVMIAADTIFPYLFFVLLLGMLYRLWVLFESINTIKINLPEKVIIVSSRNPVKSLFTGSKRFLFSDIKKFVISENDARGTDSRYFISAILKDATQKKFTEALEKTKANQISGFLNRVI